MFGTIKNFTLFKLGWLACVISAAAGAPEMGILCVGCVVALNLFDASNAAKELLLLAVAGFTGLLWESLLVATELVKYPGSESAWLAPVWIVAMWVLFATTINRGLSWVKKHWSLALVAGLFGGPMAFYGGSSMGAVSFPDATLSLVVIGVGWALLLPFLALIAEAIIDSHFLEPAADPESGSQALAKQAMVLLHGQSDLRS